MISLINFSVKTSVIFLTCLTLLTVSALIVNPEVSAQDIPAPMEFKSLTADRRSPQFLMTDIEWTAAAAGGEGTYTYEFHLLDDSRDRLMQKGPSPKWRWTPKEEGLYRAKVVISDSRGTAVDSGWSPDYKIVPKLLVEQMFPDRPSPEVRMTPIRWHAKASGGAGDLSYEFHTLMNSKDNVVQTGPSPFWTWTPEKAGYYRIKVVVSDTLGNTVDNGWSPYYEIVPKLKVELVPDMPSPQAAAMTTIRWTVSERGGVSEQTYEFHLIRDTVEKIVQKGPLPYWNWRPEEAGFYRVKVVASDKLGNRADSGWSPEFEVTPRLFVANAVSDRTSPQAALISSIEWSVKAKGGVGAYTYEFHTLKDSEDLIVQTGPSAEWKWTPSEAGTYRVKVIVRDSRGNRAESDWSPDYVIEPNMRIELAPDRPSPQAAVMTTIRWNARAEGGAGPYAYEFHLVQDWPPPFSLIIKNKKAEKGEPSSDGEGGQMTSQSIQKKKVKIVQTGPSPTWDWTPMKAGTYRVKVIAKDARGNTAESDWSADYEIASELVAEQPVPDRPSPQAAVTTTIRWTAGSSGGVGAHTYEFYTLRDSAELLEQTGPSPHWDWTPLRSGQYRIKVVVRDTLGNTVESDWSAGYEIAPELVAEQPVPDRPSPQAAVTTTIWWTVTATGGVGAHTYEFHIRRDSKERVVQSGMSPELSWIPEEAGSYRIRAVVRDSLGNSADSGWSPEYEIDTFNKIYSPVAVLPVDNISMKVVPIASLRQSMKVLLRTQGLSLVDDNTLEDFMAKHRIRFTGGLDREKAQAFQSENIAGAVLITTLEYYDEKYPPKIAITSRLVSTKDRPEILWMDSIGLAGDDSPEILGLGLIKDSRMLLYKAVQRLSDSFASFLKGNKNRVDKKRGWLEETRFEPKVYHRSSLSIDRDKGYTIAVLPFFNRSASRYAGEIMEDHFVREMGRAENFKVIEPGMVRDALLKLRVIMYDGISLNNAMALFSMLNVDFIVTGTVIDYKDYVGPTGKPKVDFSILLIDRKSSEAIWSSKSYNEGDDDVYFFDIGKVNTSSAMASEMVRAVVKKMLAR